MMWTVDHGPYGVFKEVSEGPVNDCNYSTEGAVCSLRSGLADVDIVAKRPGDPEEPRRRPMDDSQDQ